jgi:hypothetical protein
LFYLFFQFLLQISFNSIQTSSKIL